jgi:hypothetical protein
MPPPVCRPCDRSADARPPQNMDNLDILSTVVENSTEPAIPDNGIKRAYRYRYKTGPLFVGFLG